MIKSVRTAIKVKRVMILRHFMEKKSLNKEINNSCFRNRFNVNDFNKIINSQHNLSENQNLIKLFKQ